MGRHARETGIYIGECQLFDITDHYLGELGYYFRREYWGAGYAYEAAEAVCNYAGDVLKLGRLCANVDTANERSKRLLERLGFCSGAAAGSKLRRQSSRCGVLFAQVIRRPKRRVSGWTARRWLFRKRAFNLLSRFFKCGIKSVYRNILHWRIIRFYKRKAFCSFRAECFFFFSAKAKFLLTNDGSTYTL